MVHIVRPVPGEIRGTDPWGSGGFNASRMSRRHRGVDLVAKPGETVVSPVSGVIERFGQCYPDSKRYRLVVIKCEWAKCRLLYVAPKVIVGQPVVAGEEIGVAQDIAARYSKRQRTMTNHVHFEIELLPGSGVLYGRGYTDGDTVWLNPELLLGD